MEQIATWLAPIATTIAALMTAANLGACVDAMAGAKHGRLAYLVVTSGGVGGVGDTVRRLDWHDAKVDGERVSTALDQPTFERLETLQKDDWR
ncbi:hypothetical protein [Sphingomonas sp.]|uniref:hypothetical protein n=1 Tax=Sphingomonas sp. TaxID=28214 RepID=UPI0037524100